MKVTVNGDGRDLADGATVAEVVEAVTGQVTGLAVAVNGEVVPRAEWNRAALRPGDRVEVLTAAQGG